VSSAGIRVPTDTWTNVQLDHQVDDPVVVGRAIDCPVRLGSNVVDEFVHRRFVFFGLGQADRFFQLVVKSVLTLLVVLVKGILWQPLHVLVEHLGPLFYSQDCDYVADSREQAYAGRRNFP
jgi:hypothetical protein